MGRMVRHLHPASFANAVLLLAMLPEIGPLPVAAAEDDLIVEAHVVSDCAKGWVNAFVYIRAEVNFVTYIRVGNA